MFTLRSRRRPVTAAAMLLTATALSFTLPAPAALAQYSDTLSLSQLQALGGFALQGEPNVRVDLTPGGDGLVNLNYYGRNNARFTIPVRQDPQHRHDLIGEWRVTADRTATVRITVRDQERAISLSLEGRGSPSSAELADFPMGTFHAQKPGDNWTGKDMAGEWFTNDGSVHIREGGSSLFAYHQPMSGAGRRFSSRHYDTFAGNLVVVTGPWEAVDGSARGQMTLRFPDGRQGFEGQVVTEGRPEPQTLTGSRTPKAPAGAREAALKKWPGTYFSSEGSRVTLRSMGGMFVAEGTTKGGAAERFSLTPTDRLAGNWFSGSTRGTMTGSLLQAEGMLEFTVTADGPAKTYRLCRAASGGNATVNVTRTLWAELSDHSLSKQADGTTSLHVRIRMLNSGNPAQLTPAEVSLALPDTPFNHMGASYYNPDTGRDDAANPWAGTCQETYLNIRFKNVTAANKTLAIDNGTLRVHSWDISALTATIAEPAPSQPSQAALDAKLSWPGHYYSSEGSLMSIHAEDMTLSGTGVSRPNEVPESFRLTLAEKATGTWKRGARQGSAEGALQQSPEKLEFRVTAAGDTAAYTLCRTADPNALTYLGKGLWAGVRGGSVEKGPEGTHILFVKTRVLNTGPSRVIKPDDVTVQVMDAYASAPATAYYNPATGKEDAPFPTAGTCAETEIIFRIRNIKRTNKVLTFKSEFSNVFDADISAITGTIGQETPAEPQPQQPQQPQQPTQPRPVPQEPQPQPEPPEDDFQPLGIWDVRVDKVENPREDRLTHVYVTLRNASTQPQLQTGDVWVYLEDTSGATQRTGQGVRAIPGPPQLFGSPPPVTLPGKTIKAKYIFDRVKGASISKITVVEGDQQAEFEF